jgi:hypothetical protein
MKRLIDIECSVCEMREMDVWREPGEYGECVCGAPMVRRHVKPAAAHGDDIPGGVDIPHAICHENGTPKRYYSKSEIAKALAEKGWSNRVTHIPERGSDKSKHTTRWV